MKIAYVICVNYCISHFNGIRMQANEWADELQKQGCTVVRVNPWNNVAWETFDIVHIFGQVDFLYNFCRRITDRNKNIVLSPIIDTVYKRWAYKLVSHIGSKFMRLYSVNYQVRISSRYIKLFLARTQHEYSYIHNSYSVPDEKIRIVPLSFRLPKMENVRKEDFCLHVSKITDKRKNVLRLCLAAKKFGFKLILAGSISSEEDFRAIKEVIDKNENISYVGRLSDADLLDYYCRAKVFALPSINEGVGLVALEAAVNGCEIVVTELGGPKEYYGEGAYTVNPYDINDIGEKIMQALYHGKGQPQLSKTISEKFNLQHCVYQLREAYKSILS